MSNSTARTRRGCLCLLVAIVLTVARVAPVLAQPALLAPSTSADGESVPVPVEPEVVARDSAGRVTVRATRLSEKLIVDGRLDEPVYQTVRSFGDFVQQEPHEGEAATERTEAWVFFDDSSIYISARCWQDPTLRLVANDMRRDGQNIFRNDNFGVILDTFHDRRNGFLFHTNPVGGLFDSQVTDEGASINRDWNTVWDARPGRFDGGWTVEIVIPFKSLRFPAGGQQVWGIGLRRIVQAKNELSYLTRIPASAGPRGITRVSLAATLVGLDVGGNTRPLEVKPYALGMTTTDLELEPSVTNDLDGKLGFDVKASITRGLVADFTLNTDFAQVEEDETQVNLTRFDVFFPEKREFFLEGQGIFTFGGAQGGGGYGGGGGPPSDTPVLFFSRRIGLSEENEAVLGIDWGARLTGRAGPYTLGLLQIRQDQSQALGLPTTDFTVARVKRDILRRSSIGALVTYRSDGEVVTGANTVVGADAYFAFYENLFVNAYVARSASEGLDGDDTSYRGEVTYDADRYGLQLEYLSVGDAFNPEVGFLRREDFKRSYVGGRFSPRPSNSKVLRKWGLEPSFEYITNSDFQLETQQAQLFGSLEFQNGDRFSVGAEHSIEVLRETFELTDKLDIPVGSYRFSNLRMAYELGPQRRVTGRVAVQRGGFYDGDRTEARFRGRVEVTSRLSLEPTIALNWVDTPYGDDTLQLYSVRTTMTLTPRVAVSALVQQNSQDQALGGSVRLRWEYRPGSDLFVVYSEGRDTDGPGVPFLQHRNFAIKLTRLVRF